MNVKFLCFVLLLINLYVSCTKSGDLDKYTATMESNRRIEQEALKYYKAGNLNESEKYCYEAINYIKEAANYFNYEENFDFKTKKQYLKHSLNGIPFGVLGLIYFEKEDYKKALKYFKKDIICRGSDFLTTPDVQLGYYLALLSAKKINKVKENLEYFNQVGEYANTIIRLPVFYYEYTKELIKLKEYDKALMYIDLGIDVYNTNKIPPVFEMYDPDVYKKERMDYYNNIKDNKFRFSDKIKSNIKNMDIKLNVTLEEMENLKRELEK